MRTRLAAMMMAGIGIASSEAEITAFSFANSPQSWVVFSNLVGWERMEGHVVGKEGSTSLVVEGATRTKRQRFYRVGVFE